MKDSTDSSDSRWGQETADLLRSTTERAIDYLRTLPDRPVAPDVTVAELRALMGGELTGDGVADAQVIAELAHAGDRGAVAMAGPRYFGFVIGGALPVTVAAEWLTSAWDQNAGLYVSSPSAAVAEEVAASWLLDLFDLPRDASVGFTTGCQMANFTALAAARSAVLGHTGWDVEEKGLIGAPPVRVVVGDEVHVTILIALQMLGLGRETVERVPADDQGRMIPAELRRVLSDGDAAAPMIVCAQAGNVNTGASDPVDEIAPIVREHHAGKAWLHVDGAFGLWARTVPHMAAMARGVELADSWATDAHKWLNVPYDNGIVMIRDTPAHRASMMLMPPYLIAAQSDERDPSNYVPEFSRRARGFTVYAALRSLGRSGVTDLVGRCSAIAARMADNIRVEPGVQVLNDVTLNQVLVRFGDDDDLTRETIKRVQEDGTCWLGGTTWHGMAAMRISVSSWATTEADADLSTDAILRCFREARERR